jgi:predicted ArsR family transcriptional regulator
VSVGVKPSEGSGRRLDVLSTLKAAAAPMTIAQIAGELGVHPNTVRFHLGTLVADGRVERVQPVDRRPGRPPLMFRAVRRMDPGGPRRYRMLAEILTLGLSSDQDASAKALDAGREWGRRLDPPTRTAKAPGPRQSIDRLVGLLDDMGFAPERQDAHGQTRVGLRHCPFLELAEHRSDVVCPIHLGLMQGALEKWDAPITVDRLDAFVEPDLCLTYLTSERAPRTRSDRVRR